jgi:pimeloyl-ACP methyl ester carboxylesterase
VREFEVMLEDNRFVDCVEAGDPDGSPLLFHNGTPGSRVLSASWDRVAAAAGWRLVSFSRAGYGTSTSKPGRTVADVAADAAEVMDAVGAGRFAVWGHSGGGGHALACRALLGDRVTVCVSSAGVAPFDAEGFDWFAGMGEANIEEFGLTSLGREHALAVLDEERQVMLGAAPREFFDSVASLLSAVDRRAMDDDDLARWISACCSEGLRDSAEGWVDDDIAFTSPWGFDVTAVTGDVRIWQGEQDKFVPPAHARWLGAHIPGAQLELHAEHGHLSLLTAEMFGRILATLPRPA